MLEGDAGDLKLKPRWLRDHQIAALKGIARCSSAPAILILTLIEQERDFVTEEKNRGRRVYSASGKMMLRAPTIRGCLQGASRRTRNKVKFGFRYSIDIDKPEEYRERRISDHEEDKRREKIRQWKETRRLFLGEALPSDATEDDRNVDGYNSDHENEYCTDGARPRARSEGFLNLDCIDEIDDYTTEIGGARPRLRSEHEITLAEVDDWTRFLPDSPKDDRTIEFGGDVLRPAVEINSGTSTDVPEVHGSFSWSTCATMPGNSEQTKDPVTKGCVADCALDQIEIAFP